MPQNLMWRKVESSDRSLPITINFWPNVENGQTVVSVEYQADKKILLEEVIVRIPCPSSNIQKFPMSMEIGNLNRNKRC